MAETTLLPCPFCGGEIPAPTRRYMSVLICPTCNAYGPGNSDMTNDELIAAWNTRATHGTLTAEQVREAIEKRFDFDVWVPAERWQAIADELNAEIGSRTCKLIDTTSPGNDDYWNSAKCSECGAEFTCAIFGRASDAPDANYCPNCCAKVVG